MFCPVSVHKYKNINSIYNIYQEKKVKKDCIKAKNPVDTGNFVT